MSPKRPVKELTLDEFSRLLSRIPVTVERVAIAGLGEPCLNRSLAAMVRALADRGHKPALYTNGTLLDEETARELVLAGLSAVVIPVDGVTQETYGKYRKNGQLEITERNVETLLALRRRHSAALFVELQMLRLPGTGNEVERWRKRWAGAGVDSLRYKPDHMGVGAPRGTMRGICPMPWRGPATVDVEGNVYPCCVQSPENRLLGNLFHSDLERCWNGPDACDVRRSFLESRSKLPSCSGCLIPIPPRLVSALGNLLDPFLARRVLSATERLAGLARGGPTP